MSKAYDDATRFFEEAFAELGLDEDGPYDPDGADSVNPGFFDCRYEGMFRLFEGSLADEYGARWLEAVVRPASLCEDLTLQSPREIEWHIGQESMSNMVMVVGEYEGQRVEAHVSEMNLHSTPGLLDIVKDRIREELLGRVHADFES